MEGTTYFLPKTVLKVNLLIEKTSITPGELHLYSERYLKKRDVATEASETYRIVSLKMRTESIPDTAKQFTARVDQKHSINSIKLNSEGIILAVNTDAVRSRTQEGSAEPARLYESGYSGIGQYGKDGRAHRPGDHRYP